jgi:DNA-binding GntR family transcriptional regulator
MIETITFRTKADLVYESLRAQIVSGKLRPGERVPISRVARELGVSEIPAREGVKRLEADGFLHFTAHKGAVVAKMGSHEVEELFAIRAELEALALRHAAQEITASQLDALSAILDAMREAERNSDAEAYGRLNREFHICAYAAQSYHKLRTLIESLWDSTDWCRRIFTAQGETVRVSLAEHQAIYEALARRDGEAAGAVLRAQKRRAAAWLLRCIEESEERQNAEETAVTR